MAKRGRPEGQTEAKEKISCRVACDLMEQVRIAVWYERTTVTDVIEAALRQMVADAQRKHNAGQPFTEKK